MNDAEVTGMMKAKVVSLLAAALAVAFVTLTPIGPVFVYGWLVPIISPVIPKPVGVPSRADAEYHWKGFGLVWKWDDAVAGGCARWTAADFRGDPVRTLYLYEGADQCGVGSMAVSRLSFLDHTTYGDVNNDWPYEECPFKLEDSMIEKYREWIEWLEVSNLGELEIRMLKSMQSELQHLDGSTLVAQQYGCRAPT